VQAARGRAERGGWAAVGAVGAAVAYARSRIAGTGDADERGRRTRVVVDIDAASFTETWLTAIEAASQP